MTNEPPLERIELEQKLDKHGKISRADVAQTLLQSLKDGTAPNATFEIVKGDSPILKALEKVN